MTARHVVILPLLAIAALAMAIPASAQPARSARLGSPAFDQGYARGLDAGRDDLRRNRAYGYVDDLEYRRAESGYRNEYGPRDWYRDAFRRGYAAGYAAGYRGAAAPAYGRPGYGGTVYGTPGTGGRPPAWSNGRGRSGGAPPAWYYDGYRRGQRVDLALENGYLDGYEAGLDDGDDGRRFNPIGERRYRNADHGYDRGYGPRELYRNRYRQAFRDGYEAGYQDGRRFGNGRPWWWPWG